MRLNTAHLSLEENEKLHGMKKKKTREQELLSKLEGNYKHEKVFNVRLELGIGAKFDHFIRTGILFKTSSNFDYIYDIEHDFMYSKGKNTCADSSFGSLTYFVETANKYGLDLIKN